MNENLPTPLLSVVMITYQHERFIKEAIHGVLAQKSEFSVELIISEDFSPDNSESIIREIIEDYSGPVQIRYIRNPSNLGMMPNFISALNKAKGTYIALCEGDDYWTDEEKLKIQVEYLEKNQNCAFCFHPAYELHDGLFTIDQLNPGKTEDFHLEDILLRNYAHTSSIVLRKSALFPLPDFFSSSMPGDHTLQCLLLKNGAYAHFIDKTMSVYRLHSAGVWSSDAGKKFRYEQALTRIQLNNYLQIKHKKYINSAFYMLADLVAMNGYGKPTYQKYRALIRNQYGIRRFLSFNYIFYPLVYSFFRKKIRR
ncbi:MAG: glycosyltransferase [Brumimicrobium sp.]|nr:glycosyltransferase [Brumimicrobium sp.]